MKVILKGHILSLPFAILVVNRNNNWIDEKILLLGFFFFSFYAVSDDMRIGNRYFMGYVMCDAKFYGMLNIRHFTRTAQLTENPI